MSPIYLDYAASTPVSAAVYTAMQQCLLQEGVFANPGSSTHIYGWQASELVEVAREQVAASIGAAANEIIFTSGATEANNLALKGYAYANNARGKHIVTAQTEHKSVLGVCAFLASQGFDITYVKPDQQGLITPEAFAAALRPDTLLASIMWVNNETGVIQDIAALSHIAHARGIAFHVDAVQALGKLPIEVKDLNIDLLSLSAHKAYGPKGVGALYVRRRPRVKLQALLHGGGQEQNLRAGTLATHQIVGMGAACAETRAMVQQESARIAALSTRFLTHIAGLPEVYVNAAAAPRVPHILSISVKGVDGEALLMALNDLAVSSGSACNSASIEPSHVLCAMGVSDQLAHSTLRISMGRFTTEADIDRASALVVQHVTRLRQLSPLWKA